MSFASLNGAAVVSGHLSVRERGVWWARLDLDIERVVAGPVSLAFGDLTLAGFASEATVFEGTTGVRVDGGRGGWSKVIQPRSYQDDAGVPLSLLLSDIVRDCGEGAGGRLRRPACGLVIRPPSRDRPGSHDWHCWRLARCD